jgi:hypothetical protein
MTTVYQRFVRIRPVTMLPDPSYNVIIQTHILLMMAQDCTLIRITLQVFVDGAHAIGNVDVDVQVNFICVC